MTITWGTFLLMVSYCYYFLLLLLRAASDPQPGGFVPLTKPTYCHNGGYFPRRCALGVLSPRRHRRNPSRFLTESICLRLIAARPSPAETYSSLPG